MTLREEQWLELCQGSHDGWSAVRVEASSIATAIISGMPASRAWRPRREGEPLGVGVATVPVTYWAKYEVTL